MQGQANVFHRYFPLKIPSVIERYQAETRRLYEVLDKRLNDHEFLVDDYSIADIATFPWVVRTEWMNIDLADYPNVQRWFETISLRPAVRRALGLDEAAPLLAVAS